MILTVEIPNDSKPKSWFAFDEADFIRKVRIAKQDERGIIFSVSTPRELLAEHGLAPDSPGLHERQPELLNLGLIHGWDTLHYRADYLLAPGYYQAEDVSEFLACVAAVAHDVKTCRVYLDEEQAMEALHADPLYAGREGFYAHMALREQLIALEVLPDDW